jgi:stearoyl-CoA desaturase (delta-9 desaturase)
MVSSVGLHLLAASGIWYLVQFPNSTIVVMAISYFFICHLAITVGAHRYFTHGAFETSKPVAMILATLFSGTAQGSLWWWVAKHLQHHEFEDIPGLDPHTPKDGFFHSHMGWMLKESAYAPPPSRYVRRFAKGGVANEVINWHRRHTVLLIFVMTMMVPALLGLIAGDIIGGLLVIGALRLVVQYHATWIVNSIGHTLGERGDNLATNFGQVLYLPIAALLTVGEAWHANHHRSSAHWRLGRRWFELDPGAYVIAILAALGLVWNLQAPADRLRVPHAK